GGQVVGVAIGTVAGDAIIGYTAAEVRALLDAAIKAAHDQAPLAAAPQWNELDAHYKTVIKALSDGRVVPFLGAGANLFSRPSGALWQAQHDLPSGGELAEYLAGDFGYPSPDKQDLLRVAQYVAVMNGIGPLYEQLRTLFNADYTPTALHQLLAMLPSLLRAKGYPRPCLLIVTTNYDDLLERTFKSVGEPFDVVTYIADGDQHGKFVHWPHAAEPRLIEKPNEYTDLPIEMPSCNLKRSIILKLHGAVDRVNADKDSYVITEDHYIDYLARKDVSNPIPSTLAAKLKKTNFLFMGYNLRDWNLRVILQRIWGEQQLSYTSWAIQSNPEALDQKFWSKRNVDIFNLRLEDYVAQLATLLSALPPFGGKP
ncbi:MAG: SIR2 family protein, partial [Chloroflexota bacterium]